MHCEDDEPDAKVVDAFDFDFEKYDLDKEQYKDLIYAETLLYHDEAARKEYEENKKLHPEGILRLKFGEKLKQVGSEKEEEAKG